MRKLVLALILLTSPAALAEGMPTTGFFADLRIGGAAPIGMGGITTGTGFTALPSFAMGARLFGRLQLGLGFNFLRFDSLGPGTDTNVFTFVPLVAVDIIKAQDERVAFYGKAGLPVGANVTCNGACNTASVVGFDLGIGVRYAPHRMFAG